MKAFEIFLQRNKISASDWTKLFNRIMEHERNFTIEAVFANNYIEFFLHAKNDLSALKSSFDEFVLRPVRKNSTEEGRPQKRIRYKLPLKKNIFITREFEKLHKKREIIKISMKFRKVFWFSVYQVQLLFHDAGKQILISSYSSFKNPFLKFEIDFEKNRRIKRKKMPLFPKVDQISEYLSSEKEDGFLEVFGFPDFAYPAYIQLDSFEFAKHTLVVGQSGAGKSKFIESFVKKIPFKQREDYTVVLIDPHGEIFPQFKEVEFMNVNFDFIKTSCNLFPSHSEPKISTELSILLFKTLLGGQFNAKMERVLKYTIFTLFLRKKMSIKNLKNFLTELEFRKSEIDKLGEEYDYLTHFFESEFIEMQTKFYEISIMPVLVLIDELNFLPAFSSNNTVSLEECLKNNSLITFSLNRIFLGEKAIRLIAGLIIQQLFLISQKKSINKKIILILDEVSIIENESFPSILAEARKFNLSLFLSQQHLTQIKPELLKAILSNVYNYFVFKTSDEDAKILSQNLEISFPDEVVAQQKKNGSSEEDLKRKILVNLNPRECIARIFSNNRFYPCFKAKTMYLK